MADSKIKVDLEVDDHGNLKKTGRGARDAADGCRMHCIGT